MRSSRILAAFPFAALASLGFAQKKPLDHSVYDGWKSIRSTSLSRDGKWLAVIIAPQEGDATGTLRSVTDGHTISLPRASTIQFSRDGKYALATVVPPFFVGENAMLRRHLIITGRVQNVFYRAWFADQARALGLDGWVRNRADGSVEAVVQGPAEMVDAIVARAREGSPASRVADVRVGDDASGDVLAGFEKRPTV